MDVNQISDASQYGSIQCAWRTPESRAGHYYLKADASQHCSLTGVLYIADTNPTLY